jgi:NAD-dependent deacetylase
MARVQLFMGEAARHRFVFIAAGTSGAVYPAAGFVDAAARLGAETWLVNAEPAANTTAFQHFVQGSSGAVLPALLGAAGTAR